MNGLKRIRTSAAILGLGLLCVSIALCAAERMCPLNAAAEGVKMEIADVFFVTEVEGIDGNAMSIPEDSRDKLRHALVTIKVEKPAGRSLKIAACDLTLHYYHGEMMEAVPCEGISMFGQIREADRAIKLSISAGPGYLKMKTGVRSSQAAVVYIDAVFGYIEQETEEVWLCVAQPTTPQPFLTEGWKP